MIRGILVALVASAMLVLAVPAHADTNDVTFLSAIAGDGIAMDDHEAVLQAHAVCMFLEQPGGASMWDAIQQVKQMHDWTIVLATHFVDRSIQNYCPDKAPTGSSW
jgi:hypothetical protein